MPAAYDLECVDCSFRETVHGDLEDATEAVVAHREERSALGADHFVNVHRRD